jgi:hypothetical protein
MENDGNVPKDLMRAQNWAAGTIVLRLGGWSDAETKIHDYADSHDSGEHAEIVNLIIDAVKKTVVSREGKIESWNYWGPPGPDYNPYIHDEGDILIDTRELKLMSSDLDEVFTNGAIEKKLIFKGSRAKYELSFVIFNEDKVLEKELDWWNKGVQTSTKEWVKKYLKKHERAHN